MNTSPEETAYSAEVLAAHEQSLVLAQVPAATRDQAKLLEQLCIAAEGGHPRAQCNWAICMQLEMV